MKMNRRQLGVIMTALDEAIVDRQVFLQSFDHPHPSVSGKKYLEGYAPQIRRTIARIKAYKKLQAEIQAVRAAEEGRP